jgi:hypothetical protein
VPEDAFESNYAEEPLAEDAEEVPADALPALPAGAGGEEGGDE